MGKLSDDEGSDSSSSSSSSNEFLVPANKIDLSSSFFSEKKKPAQKATPKTKKTPAKSKGKQPVKLIENLSDDDEDDDCSPEDNLSSAELLAQVLKNLESANQRYGVANADDAAPSTSGAKQPGDTKADLSKEIEDLLMQGESQPSSSKVVDKVEVKQESKEDVKQDYAIPEKGVQIHLPGQNFLFDKKQKKQQDLQKALQNKINQRIRKSQMYMHKVGLLCWIAHGFKLNKLANHPDLLKHSMNLVAPQNYPKKRPDLKYFEKFTNWFTGLFQICEEHKEIVFTTDILIQRVKDKKIYNYIELVLLYIATVRGLGVNCRLIISLQPPRLKPKPSQLFKIPKENDTSTKSIKDEDEDEDVEMEDVTEESTDKNDSKQNKNKTVAVKPAKKNTPQKESTTAASGTRGRKRKTKEPSVSPTKVVPVNSREAAKTASEQAKKKAAEILKAKPSGSSLKNCKVVLNRSESKQEIKEDNKKKGKKTVEENKSNEGSKRTLRSVQPKRLPHKNDQKETKDDTSDDSDDESKNKNNLSIAKKLSLRVRKKETITKTKATNKKSTRNTSKVSTKTKNKKNNSSDEEMYESEEVDSSSNFEGESSEDDFSTDSEYENKKPQQRPQRKSIAGRKPANKSLTIASKSVNKSKNPRKLISTDEEEEDVKKGYNVWVEVYVEAEESWISISVLDKKIHCASQLFKKANRPVLYVVAWNSEGTLKDVTRRYCPNWLTDTRKKRVEEKWWDETLSYWKEHNSVISKTEDEQLLQRELEQPLPTTIGECKGHPLYVLQRHLLKFEALYPPDAVPLGHLKTGDAIYSRHCVHTLRSRETWIKFARVVKPAQEPYKIVKAMPKYDKLSGMKIKDQPLELFGKWQTTPYEPPVAKDGKVPRNEYGNVDLFKMCMLPKGCVYIDLPALNRIARKLNIDCAPACIGFNFGCRGALPAFQGFVVCEEYEDTVREAWEEEQVLAQQRAQEKREKRIYGNWKKLIKGLLIRMKLAAKYNFKDEENTDDYEEQDKEEQEEKKPATRKKKPTATKRGGSTVTRKSKRKKIKSDEEESC